MKYHIYLKGEIEKFTSGENKTFWMVKDVQKGEYLNEDHTPMSPSVFGCRIDLTQSLTDRAAFDTEEEAKRFAADIPFPTEILSWRTYEEYKNLPEETRAKMENRA